MNKTAREIDKQIIRNVDEINYNTNEIAKLNKQIATLEASGEMETGVINVIYFFEICQNTLG